MVINPFAISKVLVNEKEDIVKFTDEEVISYLQKIVVDNYAELLQKELKENIINVAKEILFTKYNLRDEKTVEYITTKLLDKMFGYDFLQKYIEMDEVTDIRAVKYNLIYIKKRGKWIKIEEKFKDLKTFEEYIRYCVIKNNSNINFDTPIVVVSDNKYNLRIEAGIAPVNLISPNLVIRIHRPSKISLQELFIEKEMLDADSYVKIIGILNKEKNVIISGKGGAGKTTLLSGIINELSDDKAITINEETVELYIDNKNVIEREVVENREYSKRISLERLMKHSLVMSNDILVIGELKSGEETVVLLDAMSTGHQGFATVHANCAIDTVDRLTTLFKRDARATEYKEEFIAKILANSIDYIIYLEKFKVSEILGISYDNKKGIITNYLYKRLEI